MRQAVKSGLAEDAYPDERIELLDTASSDAIGAGVLRAKGFTGKGVTVGIVDSGCDATQPDLADHVVHNVSLYSPEYANQQPDGSTTLVVPVDKGPYSNTDIGGGHGTHVAGIVAADSTSVHDGSRYGVAPDANLACFSIGEVLFTTAVVTAYDYILSQPKMLGIDVINNSWGNSYRQFDPDDPVSVATKAVADRGVAVVFASGNSGAGDSQASLNPFSQSPWVISVAAGTLDRRRGDFSSNGLVDDNSKPVGIGADGHTSFTGDRIGLVHPDVTAPGVDISSTCNPAGTVIGQCPPGSNTTASGTSMASPHIAGAAAVLLQAQPALSPSQIRGALEATATPVLGPDKKPLPFWEVGFGYVNLDRAVKLVRRSDWRTALAAASRQATARVRGADGHVVERTDFWTYPAPPVTFQGSDTHTYQVAVSDTADHLRVTVAHPSLGTVGANLCSYTATVKAPNGRVIGTTADDQLQGSGTAAGIFPVRRGGTYTVTITGDYAGSDPDTIDSDSVLGRVVVTHVAQLHQG
jgi:serine protease AprX